MKAFGTDFAVEVAVAAAAVVVGAVVHKQVFLDRPRAP